MTRRRRESGGGVLRGAARGAPLHGRPRLVVDVQHDGLGVAGQVAACKGWRDVKGLGVMHEDTLPSSTQAHPQADGLVLGSGGLPSLAISLGLS